MRIKFILSAKELIRVISKVQVIQPTDRQMASEDVECQNGISEQASRKGTIRVKDEYRRQRNGEWCMGKMTTKVTRTDRSTLKEGVTWSTMV